MILSLPWVPGEVPLNMLWLVQAGWKVLPGPHGIGDVSFPHSRCFPCWALRQGGLGPF